MITHKPIDNHLIEDIDRSIERLLERRLISDQESFILNARLYLAVHCIRTGRPESAAHVLEAFIKTVEDLVQSERLASTEGMRLIRRLLRLLVD